MSGKIRYCFGTIYGRCKIFLGVIVLLQSLCSLQAQTTNKILLTDPEIQFEITEEVNLMYNFKFEKADSQFIMLKKRFPTHPLAYFLLGYSQYWRILPNEDNESLDPRFMAYMDTVIELSEKIYDKDEKNFEAIFFLTAAYAFKGRRLSDREKWTSATFNGSKALKYLKLSRQFKEFSPEFLFGEALFNYYAEWIPENYKAFKPVMWFFPKGDKKLGLELLKEASSKAFYTRTEAQHYLVKILLFDENKGRDALPIIKYLNQTYPDNSVFQKLYARQLFDAGNYSECEKVSLDILRKVDAGMPGYESVLGRFSTFFLGWIYRINQKEKAKMYFQRSVKFSEEVGAFKMNYYLYSLSSLAKIAVDENDKKAALIYYDKIKLHAGRKNEMYKEAKKYINKND